MVLTCGHTWTNTSTCFSYKSLYKNDSEKQLRYNFAQHMNGVGTALPSNTSCTHWTAQCLLQACIYRHNNIYFHSWLNKSLVLCSALANKCNYLYCMQNCDLCWIISIFINFNFCIIIMHASCTTSTKFVTACINHYGIYLLQIDLVYKTIRSQSAIDITPVLMHVYIAKVGDFCSVMETLFY